MAYNDRNQPYSQLTMPKQQKYTHIWFFFFSCRNWCSIKVSSTSSPTTDCSRPTTTSTQLNILESTSAWRHSSTGCRLVVPEDTFDDNKVLSPQLHMYYLVVMIVTHSSLLISSNTRVMNLLKKELDSTSLLPLNRLGFWIANSLKSSCMRIVTTWLSASTAESVPHTWGDELMSEYYKP